jgi:hypothetical protein
MIMRGIGRETVPVPLMITVVGWARVGHVDSCGP